MHSFGNPLPLRITDLHCIPVVCAALCPTTLEPSRADLFKYTRVSEGVSAQWGPSNDGTFTTINPFGCSLACRLAQRSISQSTCSFLVWRQGEASVRYSTCIHLIAYSNGSLPLAIGLMAKGRLLGKTASLSLFPVSLSCRLTLSQCFKLCLKVFYIKNKLKV